MSANAILRRIFKVLNRFFMVPMFRLGLGSLIVNPFSGYIMVLKTVGHKTGKLRYVPVNYAIKDGCVYCMAGFGTVAHWYRNLRAQPRLELILPGGALAGVADEVTDPDEYLGMARQVLRNAGFAGFFTGCNPFTASDDVLRDRLQGVPLLRIQPTGIGSGPADAGGRLWIVPVVATVAVVAALIA
ncbi:nitroreductase/quinone reductase family protein [Aggregatilinea lenta]|uniref:nitroreductase/quinone reductase family protein n=1 Tax=Aggregatilinea lenta TaxID=913108 RepID=UPI000E5B97B4|nr:nitroreductase/quinone reductase family protein [Aggregatilinea lenta]